MLKVEGGVISPDWAWRSWCTWFEIVGGCGHQQQQQLGVCRGGGGGVGSPKKEEVRAPPVCSRSRGQWVMRKLRQLQKCRRFFLTKTNWRKRRYRIEMFPQMFFFLGTLASSTDAQACPFSQCRKRIMSWHLILKRSFPFSPSNESFILKSSHPSSPHSSFYIPISASVYASIYMLPYICLHIYMPLNSKNKIISRPGKPQLTQIVRLNQ